MDAHDHAPTSGISTVPHEGRIPERERWEEYERRKRELQLKGLEPDEYEEACAQIAAALGL